MQVAFVPRDNAPERLLCEAEIVFEAHDGPLAGMKLVGFSLWKGADGEIYVTFPSRAFGMSTERRFFDYLRPADGIETPHRGREVKQWILDEYRKDHPQRCSEGLGVCRGKHDDHVNC